MLDWEKAKSQYEKKKEGKSKSPKKRDVEDDLGILKGAEVKIKDSETGEIVEGWVFKGVLGDKVMVSNGNDNLHAFLDIKEFKDLNVMGEEEMKKREKEAEELLKKEIKESTEETSVSGEIDTTKGREGKVSKEEKVIVEE